MKIVLEWKVYQWTYFCMKTFSCFFFKRCFGSKSWGDIKRKWEWREGNPSAWFFNNVMWRDRKFRWPLIPFPHWVKEPCNVMSTLSGLNNIRERIAPFFCQVKSWIQMGEAVIGMIKFKNLSRHFRNPSDVWSWPCRHQLPKVGEHTNT